QDVRPEPRADRGRPRPDERDARAEHLQHVLRPHRFRGRRPGQGRAVPAHPGRGRPRPEPLRPLEGDRRMNDKVRRPWLWTTAFTIIALAYGYPIALVVINSFKGKVFIADDPFSLPNAETFVGLENYARGVEL